jgi:hypothetical protein
MKSQIDKLLEKLNKVEACQEKIDELLNEIKELLKIERR